ncbi:type II toxin-antitoxin system VapC family toxin [Arvimicrobium flavum]|uniref:type II toxin-antitoxin system VapC family toxin n=1 Tax=Arvimicrobium flavum TaxID=3393320 RepID=UPI0030841CC0
MAVSRIAALDISVAQQRVEEYLALAQIEPVAVPPEVAALALDAFDRFGKGRHPAKLNMGDCFSYACARHYGQPLLYKGDDFALTDIVRA